MRWDELADDPCPVARTMHVIGDRWTVLILREAFRGATRFDEFHQGLGCSRVTLSQRLGHMVETGVLELNRYHDHPPRHEYRLTEQGRALRAVLMMMAEWGEAHRPRPGGVQIRRRHLHCGCEFKPVLTCSECAEPISRGGFESQAARALENEPAA